jgi:hypothetical protein
VAKEEMKEPFAPDAGYYSVLDNDEEEHHAYRIACSHETIPVAAFSPVLERVQEVHDACLFDYPQGEIPMHSERQHKLLMRTMTHNMGPKQKLMTGICTCQIQMRPV